MPRDASGNYTLPASGNPVVSGTAVSSVWANTTLADVAQGLTDSLDRSGRGSMTASFKSVDGSVALPGMTFGSETTTGMSRPSAGQLSFSVLGTEIFRAVAGSLTLVGAAVLTGSVTGAASLNVLKAGDTMTGDLTINKASGNTSQLRLGQSGIVNWDLRNVATTGNFQITNGAGVIIDSQSLGALTVFSLTSQGWVGMGGATAVGSGNFLRMQNPGNNDAGLEFTRDSATRMRIQSYNRAGAAYTDLQFDALTYRWSTSGTLRMDVSNGGNVTINAPSSGTTLVVNSTGTNFSLFASNGTVSSFWGMSSTPTLTLGTTTNHGIDVYTNNAIRMAVAAGGNVVVNAPSAGVAATINGVDGSNIANLLGGAGNAVLSLQSTAASGVEAAVEVRNSAQVWKFGLGTGVGDSSWYLNDVTRTAQPLKVTTTGAFTFNAPTAGTTATFNAVAGGFAALFQAAAASDAVAVWNLNGSTRQYQWYVKNSDSNFALRDNNAATDRLTFNTNGKATFSSAALTAVQSVAFSATPTFNAEFSNCFELGTLTANVTSSTVSNQTAGQTIQIRVQQDATGGRTFALPASAVATGSINTTANKVSYLTLYRASASGVLEGSWMNLP